MNFNYIPVPADLSTSTSLVIDGKIGTDDFSTVLYVQQVAVTGGGRYVSIDGGRVKNTAEGQSTITVGGIFKTRDGFNLISRLKDVTFMRCSLAGNILNNSFLSSMSISRMSEEKLSMYTAFQGSISLTGFVI